MPEIPTSTDGAQIAPREIWGQDASGSGVSRVRTGLWGAADGFSAGYAGLLTGAIPFFYDGTTLTRERNYTLVRELNATAITAGTPVTIWTPASGKRFRLMGFMLSSSAAASILFRYGASNAHLFRTPVLAAGGVLVYERLGNGFMPGAANDALKIDATANTTVTCQVFGIEE